MNDIAALDDGVDARKPPKSAAVTGEFRPSRSPSPSLTTRSHGIIVNAIVVAPPAERGGRGNGARLAARNRVSGTDPVFPAQWFPAMAGVD
jgi:hypothetical protein